MMSIQGKVDLNILRYANCWEDADILLKGLSLKKDKKILCIASAGDNALALLAGGPAQVHAIDLSPVQLYLAELKQLSFASFEYAEMLRFLGVKETSGKDRIKNFDHLKIKLSPSSREFWADHSKWIEDGVIHQGKFEKYFSIFRNYLLPVVHSRKTVNELFKTASVEEQRKFYDSKWNSWRWKLLMSIFFSRRVMGKYGRDPEFLRHVDIPVSDYIRTKSGDHLRASLPKMNYFLDMIFNGNFNHSLPFYLREENFQNIKANIGRLSLSNTAAESAMQDNPYDSYVLSNIFEYVSSSSFKEWVEKAAAYIPKGSTIALWNLMAPRSFAAACPAAFRSDKVLSEKLSAEDNGFFYSRFLIERRI